MAEQAYWPVRIEATGTVIVSDDLGQEWRVGCSMHDEHILAHVAPSQRLVVKCYLARKRALTQALLRTPAGSALSDELLDEEADLVQQHRDDLATVGRSGEKACG